MLEILNTSLDDCIKACDETFDCVGYSFTPQVQSCSLLTQLGRFVRQEGSLAGRKCTNCALREWTKVLRKAIILTKLIDLPMNVYVGCWSNPGQD